MNDTVRFQEELSSLRQKVDEHDRILTNDFKALVERANKRDEKMNEIHQDVKEIKNLLTGGELGGEGLVEQVRKLKEKVDSHDSKIVWASGFSASVGAMFGLLLKKLGF